MIYKEKKKVVILETEWHRKFAWFPVWGIGADECKVIIWLQFYERKMLNRVYFPPTHPNLECITYWGIRAIKK